MGKKERFYADIMSVHPEVTGSCNIVTVRLPNGEKFNFIVDCGVFQEPEYIDLNEKLSIKSENIEFSLVTHAHADHIGRLPLLTRKGYQRAIYTTDDTRTIMSPALYDSAKVLKENTKRRKKNKEKKGKKSKAEKKGKVLYTDSDVEDALELVRAYYYNQWISVNDYVDAMFLGNGHLYGAAMILVKISYPGERDINILFTGDYNDKNIFFDIEPIPDFVYSLPLTIVQESTYGYMNSWEKEETFVDNVLKCVERGGTALIPVLANGRMQEVLYKLKVMQDEEKLPPEITIYVDGKLGIKYTMMVKNGVLNVKEEMRDFLPQNVVFVDKATRGQILQNEEAKIIVTTSGMGSHGPAQTYIPAYITRKNALIQFTSYVAEGTLGRDLKDVPQGEDVKIRGVLYRKLAGVEYTNEFSSHAKADEMISFLQRFQRPNLILVNHGEAEVKDIFAKRIAKDVDAKNVAILGQYYYRINPYGLVASKSAKFL